MKNFRRLTNATALRGIAIACSLLITVMLARSLGVEDFGRFVFVQSIIVVFSIVLDGGLPHLVVREVAAHDAIGDRGPIKGVLLRATQFGTIFSGLVFVFWLLADGFVLYLYPEAANEVQLLTLALVALPFIACLAIYSAALRALERYFVGQILSLVVVRFVNLALLGLLVAFPVFGGLTVQAAISVFVASYVVAASSAAVLLWKQNGYNWLKVEASYKTSDWAVSLLPLTIIAGLQIIVTKTDVLMLRVLSGPSDVGIYHIASQLGNLAFIAKSGVMMVVGPRFARLYRDNQLGALQAELSAAARFVFFAGVPIVLILVLFGKHLLIAFFGEGFAPAYPAMVTLSVGYLILALFGSIDTLFKMTHNEKVVLRTIGVAIVLNVALNVVLIPLYGPLGAAIATVTAMIVWRLVLFQRARQILNLVTFAFYRSTRPE